MLADTSILIGLNECVGDAALFEMCARGATQKTALRPTRATSRSMPLKFLPKMFIHPKNLEGPSLPLTPYCPNDG